MLYWLLTLFSITLHPVYIVELSFSIVCSLNTTLSGSGTLQSSLNRDSGMYVRDDHCEWLLTVPENHVRAVACIINVHPFVM